MTKLWKEYSKRKRSWFEYVNSFVTHRFKGIIDFYLKGKWILIVMDMQKEQSKCIQI